MSKDAGAMRGQFSKFCCGGAKPRRLPKVAGKVVGFLGHNVDHALQPVLQSNGQLHSRSIVSQLLPAEDGVSGEHQEWSDGKQKRLAS